MKTAAKGGDGEQQVFRSLPRNLLSFAAWSSNLAPDTVVILLSAALFQKLNGNVSFRSAGIDRGLWFVDDGRLVFNVDANGGVSEKKSTEKKK